MLCKTKRDQGSNSQFLLKRGLFLVRMGTELFALLLPYPTLIVKNKGATTAFFIKIILNTSISIEYIYYFRNCWLIKIFIRMSIVRNNCCFVLWYSRTIKTISVFFLIAELIYLHHILMRKLPMEFLDLTRYRYYSEIPLVLLRTLEKIKVVRTEKLGLCLQAISKGRPKKLYWGFLFPKFHRQTLQLLSTKSKEFEGFGNSLQEVGIEMKKAGRLFGSIIWLSMHTLVKIAAPHQNCVFKGVDFKVTISQKEWTDYNSCRV